MTFGKGMWVEIDQNLLLSDRSGYWASLPSLVGFDRGGRRSAKQPGRHQRCKIRKSEGEPLGANSRETRGTPNP